MSNDLALYFSIFYTKNGLASEAESLRITMMWYITHNHGGSREQNYITCRNNHRYIGCELEGSQVKPWF